MISPAFALKTCDSLGPLREGSSENCTFPPVISTEGIAVDVDPASTASYATVSFPPAGSNFEVIVNVTAPPYGLVVENPQLNLTLVNRTSGNVRTWATIEIKPREPVGLLCPDASVALDLGDNLDVSAWAFATDANVSATFDDSVLTLEYAQNVTSMVQGIVKLASFRAIGGGSTTITLTATGEGDVTLDTCEIEATVKGKVTGPEVDVPAVLPTADLTTTATVLQGNETFNATVLFTNEQRTDRILTVSVNTESFEVLGSWKDGERTELLVMKPVAGTVVVLTLRPRFNGPRMLNVTYSFERNETVVTLIHAPITQLASGAFQISFSRDRLEVFPGDTVETTVTVTGVPDIVLPLNITVTSSETFASSSKVFQVASGKSYALKDLGLVPDSAGLHAICAVIKGLSGEGCTELLVRTPLVQSLDIGTTSQRTFAGMASRYPFSIKLSGTVPTDLERLLKVTDNGGCATGMKVEGLTVANEGWTVPARAEVNGTVVYSSTAGACVVSLNVTCPDARCGGSSSSLSIETVTLESLAAAAASVESLHAREDLLERRAVVESQRAKKVKTNAAVGGVPGILCGFGLGGLLGALLGLAIVRGAPVPKTRKESDMRASEAVPAKVEVDDTEADDEGYWEGEDDEE